jgi:ribonuclease P protein component
MRGSLNTQVQVQGNEKNISTKPDQTRKNSWFSCTQSHTGWSQGIEGASCERPPSSGTVKRPWNMRRARLQKRARLLKAAEFSRVFDKAVRSSDQYFTILARPNEFEYPRLGLAISKKKAKLAVTRNRLKRIIRESFRLQQHALYGADFIVMAGQKGGSASNDHLLQSLEKHWQKLNKLCAKS